MKATGSEAHLQWHREFKVNLGYTGYGSQNKAKTTKKGKNLINLVLGFNINRKNEAMECLRGKMPLRRRISFYLFGRWRWLLLECQLYSLCCWLRFFNYAFLWVSFWQHNKKVMTFFTLDKTGGSWKRGQKKKTWGIISIELTLKTCCRADNVARWNSALARWLSIYWLWQQMVVISAWEFERVILSTVTV